MGSGERFVGIKDAIGSLDETLLELSGGIWNEWLSTTIRYSYLPG